MIRGAGDETPADIFFSVNFETASSPLVSRGIGFWVSLHSMAVNLLFCSMSRSTSLLPWSRQYQRDAEAGAIAAIYAIGRWHGFPMGHLKRGWTKGLPGRQIPSKRMQGRYR